MNIYPILSEHYCSIIGPYINQTIQTLMITTSDMLIILVANICYRGLSIIISLFCSSHCERFDWVMNVLENGIDVNAWNNLFTIINGFLILS